MYLSLPCGSFTHHTALTLPALFPSPLAPPAKLCNRSSINSPSHLCRQCTSQLQQQKAALVSQSLQLASCSAATVAGAAAASSQLLDDSLRRAVEVLEPLIRAKLESAAVVGPLVGVLNAKSAGDPQSVCSRAGGCGLG